MWNQVLYDSDSLGFQLQIPGSFKGHILKLGGSQNALLKRIEEHLRGHWYLASFDCYFWQTGFASCGFKT